jgi:hypothetical protein
VPIVCLACELRRWAKGHRWSMMICRFPSPALPDLRPALRLAWPAWSLNGLQERGAAGAAARGRRAAPHPSPAWAELGRPAVFAALIRPLPRGLRMYRLVTPGTILWRPRLVTRKWTYTHRTDRSPTSAEFTALIERLATENNGWGTSGFRANCSSSVTRLAHRLSAASSDSADPARAKAAHGRSPCRAEQGDLYAFLPRRHRSLT